MSKTKIFDRTWKDGIEDLFEDFLLFFVPELHAKVNFQMKYSFLDKELLEMYLKGEDETKYPDKLIEIQLKDNQKKWVYVHVEVQGDNKKGFPERMFKYFYRLYDRYDEKILALVIYTDSAKKYRPEKFEYSFMDTKLVYSFRSFKILDYTESQLLESNNPFALAVLAALYLIKSKRKAKKVLFYKYNVGRHFI